MDVQSYDYSAVLKKSVWLEMVRSRFWSTFSHCSDEELEEGIRELEEQFHAAEDLKFVDRLIFILGKKNCYRS